MMASTGLTRELSFLRKTSMLLCAGFLTGSVCLSAAQARTTSHAQSVFETLSEDSVQLQLKAGNRNQTPEAEKFEDEEEDF